jgi:hypothetical protein
MEPAACEPPWVSWRHHTYVNFRNALAMRRNISLIFLFGVENHNLMAALAYLPIFTHGRGEVWRLEHQSWNGNSAIE